MTDSRSKLDEIVDNPDKLQEAFSEGYPVKKPHKGFNSNTNIPIDISMEGIYQNPFAISGDSTEHPEYGIKNIPRGLVKDYGIGETAVNEFLKSSTNAKLLRAGVNAVEQGGLNYSPTNPDWTPTLDAAEYIDLPDEYKSYLSQSKNPQDFQFRKNWIKGQMHMDDVVNNGSYIGWALGGFAGAFTPFGSLENLIPIASMAKYAKVGAGTIKNIAKVLPGIGTAAIIRSAAGEMDKINGNLKDFATNALVDGVVGAVLFGGVKAASIGLDKLELRRLGDFAKNYMQGINFNFNVNEKGHIVGMSAVAADNSVGAAAVSKAQEMADSAFHKGGLFKIPYVGDFSLKVLSGQVPWSDDTPIIGGFNQTLRFLAASPLVTMTTSKYGALRSFADKAFDHFITTTGVAKGQTAGFSVEHFMKKERAALKSMFTQVDALHFERNGLSAPVRPLRGIWNMGLAFRGKTLEQTENEVGKTDYVPMDKFLDEVQNVLWSNKPSEHDAVNTASSLFRNKIDETWKGFREAHGLPETWLPSRTAESYLMRVYDTNYLNSSEGEKQWMGVISGYLKEADETITQRMQPIRDAESEIVKATEAHTNLLKEVNIPQPSAAELAKEKELRERVQPIKEKLYKAKSALNKAKKDETKEKYRNKIDALNAELKPHADALDKHLNAIYRDDIRVKKSSDELDALKLKKRALENSLQNELRTNADLQIHVDDINAFSANEAEQLKSILKPSQELEKQVNAQKQIVDEIKSKANYSSQASKKGKTVETGQKHAAIEQQHLQDLQREELKLKEMQDKYDQAIEDLQDQAHNGSINPRFYKKIEGSERYEFKDPGNRLKFRDTYESDFHRQAAAKAYYTSILNMEPQDIIASMMGKLTGNASENVLKSRSLMIPDEVLYKNNFMSKDLKAKTANYVNYLARRTHIKNVFKDITLEGGFDEIAKSLLDEHNFFRGQIQTRIDKLNKDLTETTDPKKIKSINADLTKSKRDFAREVRDFENAKDTMKQAYENRLMGIKKRSKLESQISNVFMSLAASTNLHNLPATQITDLAAIGFQHGVMNFIRDGIYPLITSIGGILKTKDSEAMRKIAPHLNLGLNDYLVGMSEKNWGQEMVPNLNMGRIESGLEKYAQFTANADLSSYIDNGIQHIAGGVIQSNFMRIMHDFVNGNMSKSDGLYMRKYGIDPEKWADRMVKAFKSDGGYKTELGGYQSAFYQWQDLEAANLFGDAVFRGINNTLIYKGWGDSPFFNDNFLGMFFRTFSGWGYASVNRYVIPALQHPDASLVAKTTLMLTAGSLVSPMRRLARGEDMYPDEMTKEQMAYEAFSDSGVLSVLADNLNYVNMLTDDKLLGNLKNDKYRNRMQVGLGGVGLTTASKMMQVVGMAASLDFNEHDLKTLAHMTSITGSMYGRYVGDKLIEGLGTPQTRSQAQASKEL